MFPLEILREITARCDLTTSRRLSQVCRGLTDINRVCTRVDLIALGEPPLISYRFGGFTLVVSPDRRMILLGEFEKTKPSQRYSREFTITGFDNECEDIKFVIRFTGRTLTSIYWRSYHRIGVSTSYVSSGDITAAMFAAVARHYARVDPPAGVLCDRVRGYLEARV